MTKICDVNTKDFEKFFLSWETKQLALITSVALTRTAMATVPALYTAMKAAFDQPTPYTLNSVYVKPSTPSTLSARVKLKDITKKGIPATVYLAPQIFGGDRQPKRSELLMQRKGILPGGMFWVPGRGAKLDSYGNISRGQIGQVLSATLSYGQVGFLANKSFRRGARMNAQTNGIFVAKVGNPEHLEPGVYLRTAKGQVKAILIFISKPSYKKLLPFYEVIGDTYALSFGPQFDRAIRQALAGTTPTTK